MLDGFHQLLTEYGKASLAEVLREWLQVAEHAVLDEIVEKVCTRAAALSWHPMLRLHTSPDAAACSWGIVLLA